MFRVMETFTSPDDPLDQEIAAREADIGRIQASIAEAESNLLKSKQDLEVVVVEVRTLKRAAGLRPSKASPAGPGIAAPVAQRAYAPPQEIVPPTPQVGRFRDVVDQIRAGR